MVEMIIIIMIMFLIITTMSMMTIVTNLTEQGDIGRSRSEAGVRSKTLDEGRRSRHLYMTIYHHAYDHKMIMTMIIR